MQQGKSGGGMLARRHCNVSNDYDSSEIWTLLHYSFFIIVARDLQGLDPRE